MTRQQHADEKLREWQDARASRRRDLFLAWCEGVTACAALCILVGALLAIPGGLEG